MAERKALVRIAAKVDSSVRKALRGITEDTQRVTQTTERAARKRAQVSERVARQAQKGLRETSSAMQRDALQQEAIARRVASTKIRESRRSTEAEIRDFRRKTREQGGVAGATRGGRGLALGGLAVGGYHAAKGLVSEAQAAVGAGSLASRQDKAMDFFERLVIKGLEAGLTKEELPEAKTQILAAAKASHQDPTEIMEALVEAQTRFAAFQEFIPLLTDMGRVATGTGTDIRALVGMLGTAKTVFGLTGDEMREAMYFMVESARNGSVSVEDLSSSMAKFFGEFEAYAGTKGFAGFKEMAGTFQAVQKSLQAAPEEVGVRVRALMMKLAEADVQRKMARAGVVVTEGRPGAKGSTLLPVDEIAKRLAAAAASGKWNIQTAQKALVETRAVSGAVALLKTVSEEPAYFEKVKGASAAKGRELSEMQFRTLVESPWGQAKSIGIEAQIQAIKTMEEVAKVDTALAKKVTELQAEFPVLAKVLGSLETTIQMLIGALVIKGLLGGGRGGAAGTGGLLKKLFSFLSGGGAATGAPSVISGSSIAAALAPYLPPVALGVGLIAGMQPDEPETPKVQEEIDKRQGITKEQKAFIADLQKENPHLAKIAREEIAKENAERRHAAETWKTVKGVGGESEGAFKFPEKFPQFPRSMKLDNDTIKDIGRAVGQNIPQPRASIGHGDSERREAGAGH